MEKLNNGKRIYNFILPLYCTKLYQFYVKLNLFVSSSLIKCKVRFKIKEANMFKINKHYQHMARIMVDLLGKTLNLSTCADSITDINEKLVKKVKIYENG